jgi:predicted nucleic acid-binding protein
VILVDSSVWIEFFRASSQFDLAAAIDFDEIVTCLPVVQEVLQGFDEPRAFRIAREAMFALPIVESPLSAEVFEQAVDLYRAARRAGFTIRSGVDCLIAACALRHSLMVVHRDRDFDALARVAALEVKNLGR